MPTGTMIPVILEKNGIKVPFPSIRNAWLEKLRTEKDRTDRIGHNRKKVEDAIKYHTPINGYYISYAQNDRNDNPPTLLNNKGNARKKHPSVPIVTESKNIEMSKYLDQTISILVRFLNGILPNIADNWWKKTVIESLTDFQSERVRKKKITSLKGLDLAALLRIFDKNWYDIVRQTNFTYEDRNIVKEMQSVRNRWAHESDEGYKVDDIHRDLDTLQRFLRMINSDQELIDELQKKKRNIY